MQNLTAAELDRVHVSTGGAIRNVSSRKAPEKYKRIATKSPKSMKGDMIDVGCCNHRPNKVICAGNENSGDQPKYAPTQTVGNEPKPLAGRRNDPKT